MATILLIEDDAAIREMLSTWLARRGYRVADAGDGEQGLAQVITMRPDLILMDMSMPRLDGWSATRILKADPQTCTIPIIGLSAHAIGDDAEKGLIAGCDAYITKPINFPRLLAYIQQLIPPLIG